MILFKRFKGALVERRQFFMDKFIGLTHSHPPNSFKGHSISFPQNDEVADIMVFQYTQEEYDLPFLAEEQVVKCPVIFCTQCHP